MFDFLSEKFSSIFSRLTGKSHLSEKNIEESLIKIKEALIEADVPLNVVNDFIQATSQEVLGQKVVRSLKPSEQFIKIVHDRLLAFLGGKQDVEFSFQIPAIIMVLGLQGSGKTTTLAKLAHFICQQAKSRGKKRKILLASVDYYRPAAIDQLEILAKQLGVDFYRSPKTTPTEAARDCYHYFKQEQFELLLLDTAGRLHVDATMMQELKTIDAQLQPKYKLLVLDAMTGQESLHVAQAFEQGVNFQGAILTKMDSDTRAGAAFAFRYILKKPIYFIGAGEKPADLEQFYPERIANRILGMGDILTLVEKAQVAIEQFEQDSMRNVLEKDRMDLQDFADQISMMNKIGSMSQLAKYIPGMAQAQISPEMLEKGEQEMRKFKAIISSMTPKERKLPKILDGSRKKRIALGAGVQVADVNILLSRFAEMQQYAKLFKKFEKYTKFLK